MGVRFKVLFAGACAASFIASSAGAVTVGLAATETGYVEGRHVYIDPLTLNGASWFCISPDLDISLGDQPYVFTVDSLTTSNSALLTGYTLNTLQMGEIGALISKGQTDIANGASGAQIAADASAIWLIEGSTVTPDDPTMSPLILADEAWASGRNAGFFILTNSYGVQTLAGTPEPVSWALMIVGFAGVGAVMRNRRAALQSRAAVLT